MIEQPSTESRQDRLLVRDLMSDRVFAVRPDDHLRTVHELMVEHHVRHIPVVDPEDHLVGLVSHRDLLRASLIEQPDRSSFVEAVVLEQIEVRELMTAEPSAVSAGTDIREAARVMLERKYGCLPVVRDGRLVGILTEADFLELAIRALG